MTRRGAMPVWRSEWSPGLHWLDRRPRADRVL